MTGVFSKISGFQDTLKFSNSLSVIRQRITRAPIIHYVWKGSLHMYCEGRTFDHYSVKELLSQGVYDDSIRKSVKDGCISYVNVGAHIGSFDVAIAGSGAKISKAISIELNPRTYKKLCFNLLVNNLDQVNCINAGVSDQSGEYLFSENENSLTDGIFAIDSGDSRAQTPIPLITLPQAISASGLEGQKFDLLKLDCEGAEYPIIKAITPDQLNIFSNIVMELHQPPDGHGPEDLYRKLAENGFSTNQPAWARTEQPALRFWSKKQP